MSSIRIGTRVRHKTATELGVGIVIEPKPEDWRDAYDLCSMWALVSWPSGGMGFYETGLLSSVHCRECGLAREHNRWCPRWIAPRRYDDPDETACARCDGVRVGPSSYSALCASCIPRRFRREGNPTMLLVPMQVEGEPAPLIWRALACGELKAALCKRPGDCVTHDPEEPQSSQGGAIDCAWCDDDSSEPCPDHDTPKSSQGGGES